MYNPWRKNRSQRAGDHTSAPGISDRSKTIKKRKKIANLVEEEEEGAEPSPDLAGEDVEMSGDEAIGLAPAPLLDYEKYPECLELTIK